MIPQGSMILSDRRVNAFGIDNIFVMVISRNIN